MHKLPQAIKAVKMSTAFSQPFTIIAHRGASASEPENTLRSFHQAVKDSAHAIELDVHNVDGHLVVIHDDTLDRTTNSEGSIYDKTIPYLKSLNAGKGETIPMLPDVFSAVPDNIGINIELKGRNTATLVANFLKETKPTHDVLVSSNSSSELETFRSLDKDTKIGYIMGFPKANLPTLHKKLNLWCLCINKKLAEKSTLDAINSINLPTFTYTVNEPEVIEKLRLLGIVGVFSDTPCLLINHLKTN